MKIENIISQLFSVYTETMKATGDKDYIENDLPNVSGCL